MKISTAFTLAPLFITITFAAMGCFGACGSTSDQATREGSEGSWFRSCLAGGTVPFWHTRGVLADNSGRKP